MALRYELVTVSPARKERVREYASDEELAPGSLLVAEGRYWLVERVEPAEDGGSPRVLARPARYRIRLQHTDGREELGAFRRYRPGSPRLGHQFTTLERGEQLSWEIVDERLGSDEGEPFLELLAERDYDEVEDLPDHELEHALAAQEETFPEGAVATIARAEEAGFAVELAALAAGEEPRWEEAERYVDALILEEIEDDLIELCGVEPDLDPRETWLATVKTRLRSDLESLRADVEGDHDEIEEWDFLGGRVFASVGTLDEEADPDKGHGWMCRLVDSGALAAAGFERVRKAELQA